jgi:hypothetical protein
MEAFLLGGMLHTCRATHVACYIHLLGHLNIFGHILGGKTRGDTSYYSWNCIFI